ncbi:MAG: DUF2815 family protein, partial [Oscillospiraceae bacterium]|nr:DUF2815 family protein [Oscillospiraceae bacterium]
MSTKVITDPDTRWSYVHVWDPTSYNGGKPKYSVSLIIPKDNQAMVDKINAAISEEIKENDSILKG